MPKKIEPERTCGHVGVVVYIERFLACPGCSWRRCDSSDADVASRRQKNTVVNDVEMTSI